MGSKVRDCCTPRADKIRLDLFLLGLHLLHHGGLAPSTLSLPPKQSQCFEIRVLKLTVVLHHLVCHLLLEFQIQGLGRLSYHSLLVTFELTCGRAFLVVNALNAAWIGS